MKIFFFILILPTIAYSQHNLKLDSFALNIPDSLTQTPYDIANIINKNYDNDYQKVRVLYTWITNNIEYVDTLTSSENDSLSNLDIVMYPLISKKGLCKNFSALFTSLCSLVGLESYSVLGYTMINKKFNPTKDHAWNIVKIEDDYFLFDPTWDSNKRFMIGEYNYKYFMCNPDFFIKSHMPYDPIMQLLNFPITHQEFFLRKFKGNRTIDYKAELKQYYKLNEIDRLKSTLYRAEKNKIEIPELEFLHQQLKNFVKKNTSEKN